METFRWFVELDGQLGRGLGGLAVQLLVQKIFQETNLRKLTALVHDQNISSTRLLEKLGFKKEGLLREHFIINGKPENEVAFGLLRRKWDFK